MLNIQVAGSTKSINLPALFTYFIGIFHEGEKDAILWRNVLWHSAKLDWTLRVLESGLISSSSHGYTGDDDDEDGRAPEFSRTLQPTSSCIRDRFTLKKVSLSRIAVSISSDACKEKLEG